MFDLRNRTALPAQAGIGLRHPHLPEFLAAPQPAAWLEIHSENYLAPGGPRLGALERLRGDYPLSCHGVGLSLGSAAGLDAAHLARLRYLYDRLEPEAISEHLAWSTAPDGTFLADLLPLPYTDEALAIAAANIERAQQALGRRLLVENPSTYLRFQQADWDEAGFLSELVRCTGCGLLLDVNNLYVSAVNHGSDPQAVLNALPLTAVGEIHIAGHARVATSWGELLIDDHGSPVAGPVWALLAATLRLTGPCPVLMEWDTNIPELPVLLAEAERAEGYLREITGASG
ncbi:MAG TPA: DUF692 domain-containing protein [Candidatus Competibacteraceae bacterium]|nr:DUF692 domain-containing protein [Candidatus Competibacteraceae bacterium]MCP5134346.1 DUF692 domain-containing protein [Gammaproteobacteria bacterium]HPF58893.1 DUF692 domain-containing protein [Candidatus Competibacteraceae bacterium]HRY18405.1 DUF692 domain-containing protein [Candidatus Competibacteraceae bacterium]